MFPERTFLIARVIPHGGTEPRYRCIAGIHHKPWRWPVLHINYFIELVQVPRNACIVAEEIKALNGKYGPKLDDPPKMSRAPCQYACLLLANAFCIDIEEPPSYDVSAALLPATMGCFDGGYRNDIIIFDVTDPLHPTYTIASSDGAPQQARSCMSAFYYFDPNISGERCSTLNSLHEVWPKEFPPTGLVEFTTKKAKFEIVSSGESQDVQSENRGVPALVDLTLKSALVQALQMDCAPYLERFVQSSTAKMMKECLRKAIPFTFGATQLMSCIVEVEAHSPANTVDLSNFTNCTTEYFPSMLPSSVRSIDTLNLSHNTNVTVNTLRSILERVPKIRRLVLFDTGITNEDLGSLLASHPQFFFHVESLVHPLCLTDPNLNTSTPEPFVLPYPSQFTFISTSGFSTSPATPSAFYLPTFTLPKIIQALAELLEPFTDYQRFSLLAVERNCIKGILGSEFRKGESFGKRSISTVPTNQLWCDGEPPDLGEEWIFTIWYENGKPNLPSLGFFRRQRIIAQSKSEGTPNEEGSNLPYEAHTLNSFLATCEKEGRPPALLEDIARLQKILNRMLGFEQKKDIGTRKCGKLIWSQMTPEIFASMFKTRTKFIAPFIEDVESGVFDRGLVWWGRYRLSTTPSTRP